jgi:hypothetical protein
VQNIVCSVHKYQRLFVLGNILQMEQLPVAERSYFVSSDFMQFFLE